MKSWEKKVASKVDFKIAEAASDFVATQAKKTVGDVLIIKYHKMLVRDVLIDYIKEHGIKIK